MTRIVYLIAFVAITAVTWCSSVTNAADWPAYRGNSGRTATTSEQLSFPLTPMWKYVPAN